MTARKLIVFALILFAGILLPLHIKALSTPPTSDPSSTASISSEQIRQNIKQRLEKIQQGTDPQVEGMMTSLKQHTFGVVGTLEKNVGSTLQIKTYKGDDRVIEMDKDAIMLKNGKEITKSDLELNTPVIVMGYVDSDSTYIGRRLVITDETVFPVPRETIFGKIVSLITRSISLLTHNQGSIDTLNFKLLTKTLYFDSIGQPIKRTDLLINDNVVLVLDTDPTASTSADRVYSLSAKPKSSPIALP